MRAIILISLGLNVLLVVAKSDASKMAFGNQELEMLGIESDRTEREISKGVKPKQESNDEKRLNGTIGRSSGDELNKSEDGNKESDRNSGIVQLRSEVAAREIAYRTGLHDKPKKLRSAKLKKPKHLQDRAPDKGRRGKIRLKKKIARGKLRTSRSYRPTLRASRMYDIGGEYDNTGFGDFYDSRSYSGSQPKNSFDKRRDSDSSDGFTPPTEQTISDIRTFCWDVMNQDLNSSDSESDSYSKYKELCEFLIKKMLGDSDDNDENQLRAGLTDSSMESMDDSLVRAENVIKFLRNHKKFRGNRPIQNSSVGRDYMNRKDSSNEDYYSNSSEDSLRDILKSYFANLGEDIDDVKQDISILKRRCFGGGEQNTALSNYRGKNIFPPPGGQMHFRDAEDDLYPVFQKFKAVFKQSCRGAQDGYRGHSQDMTGRPDYGRPDAQNSVNGLKRTIRKFKESSAEVRNQLLSDLNDKLREISSDEDWRADDDDRFSGVTPSTMRGSDWDDIVRNQNFYNPYRPPGYEDYDYAYSPIQPGDHNRGSYIGSPQMGDHVRGNYMSPQSDPMGDYRGSYATTPATQMGDYVRGSYLPQPGDHYRGSSYPSRGSPYSWDQNDGYNTKHNYRGANLYDGSRPQYEMYSYAPKFTQDDRYRKKVTVSIPVNELVRAADGNGFTPYAYNQPTSDYRGQYSSSSSMQSPEYGWGDGYSKRGYGNQGWKKSEPGDFSYYRNPRNKRRGYSSSSPIVEWRKNNVRVILLPEMSPEELESIRKSGGTIPSVDWAQADDRTFERDSQERLNQYYKKMQYLDRDE